MSLLAERLQVFVEIHPQGGWAVPPFEYVTAWKSHTPFSAPNFVPLPVAPVTLTPPPGPPEGIVPLDSSDITSASGLDPEAVVAAVGATPEGATSNQPADAIAAISAAAPPGFAGLR